MLGSLFRKVFGSRNDRILKTMKKDVERINLLEPEFEALSDAELKEKTAEFRKRLNDGERIAPFFLWGRRHLPVASASH